MATQTTNFNMTKPGSADLIDINVLNANFDIIDSKMKENNDMAKAAITSTPSRSIVNLTTTWSGSGPYTQVVTVDNVTITPNSKIDLQPDSTVLNQLLSDGVQALWIQNDGGVLTAYAIGASPSVALSIQCLVSLTETSVAGIAVTTQPTKTTYAVGNTLDLSGLVVTATFADGTTSVVTDDCTFSIADGSTLSLQGTQTIAISYLYNGITKNTAFFITVVAAIESLEVTTEPTKDTYMLGEELDLTGLVITATYTDNTTADVTSSCVFNPDDGDELSFSGMQAVYVTYEENGIQKATAFGVTVIATVLESIAVTTQPTTTTYTVGDVLNLEGIVVTATYDNEYESNVTSGCVFSPANGDTLSTAGEQTISVAYSENDVTKITSFAVTVNASE